MCESKKLLVKGDNDILEPTINKEGKLNAELADKVENLIEEKKASLLEFESLPRPLREELFQN